MGILSWRKWLLILKCIATAVSCAQGADYQPTIAAAGGFAAASTPAPRPAPSPGNICPDCNGKGWIGDGTVRNHCTRCDGTGKLTTRTAKAPPVDLEPAPAPELDAFYYAEHDYNEAVRQFPDAVPLVVFYWPSEADQAAVAYRNLMKRNQAGQYVVIPLCLADQWDADHYVAEHWRRCTRQVVRIAGGKEELITDLKQLED